MFIQFAIIFATTSISLASETIQNASDTPTAVPQCRSALLSHSIVVHDPPLDLRLLAHREPRQHNALTTIAISTVVTSVEVVVCD